MSDRVGEHTFAFQPTPLRAEPSDDAEQVSEVLPGEPLTYEGARAGWVSVRTAYGYPGWVREDALGGEPDPRWLEPKVANPLAYARTLLGAPYRWGGMTEHGIDCSGLVHMSFRATGRLVPRDADQQEEAGVPVDELRPGDLVSYGDADQADHISFWLGEGLILHATRRDGVEGVLEELEPPELLERRRRAFKF